MNTGQTFLKPIRNIIFFFKFHYLLKIANRKSVIYRLPFFDFTENFGKLRTYFSVPVYFEPYPWTMVNWSRWWCIFSDSIKIITLTNCATVLPSVAATKLSSKFHTKVSGKFVRESLQLFAKTLYAIRIT